MSFFINFIFWYNLSSIFFFLRNNLSSIWWDNHLDSDTKSISSFLIFVMIWTKVFYENYAQIMHQNLISIRKRRNLFLELPPRTYSIILVLFYKFHILLYINKILVLSSTLIHSHIYTIWNIIILRLNI